MVETERETFTVVTIGSGQPDYSQPTLAPQALIVKYPEMEIAGKKYDDFIQISFTATQQEYVIGTNANAAKLGSWPTGTLAKEMVVYTVEGCWVRFNDPSAVAHYVPPQFPMRFFKRTEKIYVYQDSTPGTAYIWIEG